MRPFWTKRVEGLFFCGPMCQISEMWKGFNSEWSPRLKQRAAAATQTLWKFMKKQHEKSQISIPSSESLQCATCPLEVKKKKKTRHNHTTVPRCWRRQKTNKQTKKQHQSIFFRTVRARIKSVHDDEGAANQNSGDERRMPSWWPALCRDNSDVSTWVPS